MRLLRRVKATMSTHRCKTLAGSCTLATFIGKLCVVYGNFLHFVARNPNKPQYSIIYIFVDPNVNIYDILVKIRVLGFLAILINFRGFLDTTKCRTPRRCIQGVTYSVDGLERGLRDLFVKMCVYGKFFQFFQYLFLLVSCTRDLQDMTTVDRD